MANADRRRRHVAKKQALYSAEKARRGCRDCPERDPIVLDFHHRNADDKHSKLKDRRRSMSHLTWEELADEMDKCDVLCANCHRREEHRRRTERR